jgi:Ca-activated chloride channel family protein
VVLLSDGTNTTGRSPTEAAIAASAAGVPVSTIAYGTEGGVMESLGYSTPVPADAETLAELAEATNGTAYAAASSDELVDVYRDISSSIGWRTEWREVTPFVAALGLVFGLVAAALSLRWFSRMV